MRKILEKYKSLEERNLNSLKNELLQIQNEIEKISKEIQKLNERLNNFNYSSFSYVSDFALAGSYLESIRKNIGILSSKLDKLHQDEEKLKDEISQVNAKIKVIEKYIEKLDKKQLKEDLKNEVRLIDEIFNRKFTSY